MAEKSSKSKAADSGKTQTSVDAASELNQLRDIVFGAAKRSIEQRIDALEASMQNEFALMRESQASNVAMLQKTLQDATEKLTSHLENVDQSHTQKSDELNAYADRLSSELEMAESTGKEDTEQLHVRMDKEVRELTQNFTDKFSEAMRKLEQVTQDLTTSKTDRKTLAKLLATVATNLETDDENE